MNKTFAALLATSLTAAALVAATATPALAATGDDPTTGPGSTLAAIQKAGEKATDKRIRALEAAITRVEGNDRLTDDDRATILATLNADLDGMHDLATQIASDTTKAEAAADYEDIFTEYRVFAVALPQSMYAAGADALTGSAIPRLHDAYDKLEARLADGDSTPELEALLADMQQKIQDAEAGSDGLAADALAVSPDDWSADHTVLADIRMQLREAARDARDAARDGRQIAEALK